MICIQELIAEKKVLEEELKLEKLTKDQELQKKEREIAEHNKQLVTMRKKLKLEKQNSPVWPEVGL